MLWLPVLFCFLGFVHVHEEAIELRISHSCSQFRAIIVKNIAKTDGNKSRFKIFKLLSLSFMRKDLHLAHCPTSNMFYLLTRKLKGHVNI